MDESHREVISELDNEWHTLKHGNPVPGLYPQTGTEQVRVRGNSGVEDDRTVTTYEIIVTDGGEIMGRYRVIAEEALAEYSTGYGSEAT
jgi:hypothetical protein